jgi:hypothetical protein
VIAQVNAFNQVSRAQFPEHGCQMELHIPNWGVLEKNFPCGIQIE